MQQGHTYVTDEAPAIPQSGEADFSGQAPVQYAPPSAHAPGYGGVAAASPVVVIGVAAPAGAPQHMASDEALARQLAAQERAPGGARYPAAPVYGQNQQQQQPYFAPPPYPGAHAPQPQHVGAGYPGSQQLTPITPAPVQMQGSAVPYYNGQPVAMGVAVPQHASGQSYGAPVMPGGQGYAVQAVAMPMQPTPYGMPMGQQQVRPGQRGHLPPGFWSDGLCECGADCASCCLSCLFIPYRWAKTISMLQLSSSFGQAFAAYFIPWLIGLVFYILSDTMAWAFFVALIAHVFLVFMGCAMRGRIRAIFSIQGDSCEDCCLHCCCTCCAVAQEARHVDRDFGLLPPAIVYR